MSLEHIAGTSNDDILFGTKKWVQFTVMRLIDANSDMIKIMKL